MKIKLTFLLTLFYIFLCSIDAFSKEFHEGDICGGKCMVIETYDVDGESLSVLQDFVINEDRLKDIFFEFDNYDLSDNAKSILKKNVAYLKRNPSFKIEIQGNCDERGVNNYNIALSERRAQSTKQYMVSQGVDPSNVQTIGYGEEKPLCFESNETCWQENRRVHFLLIK
jgi:peptidoglycan-associated lipoprotein